VNIPATVSIQQGPFEIRVEAESGGYRGAVIEGASERFVARRSELAQALDACNGFLKIAVPTTPRRIP
jgi:hypothetical protein